MNKYENVHVMWSNPGVVLNWTLDGDAGKVTDRRKYLKPQMVVECVKK